MAVGRLRATRIGAPRDRLWLAMTRPNIRKSAFKRQAAAAGPAPRAGARAQPATGRATRTAALAVTGRCRAWPCGHIHYV